MTTETPLARQEFKKFDQMPANATIARSYTFEAAHTLDKLPPMHKCRRMHGHSYKVEVRISGPVDDIGLVRGVEFGTLDVVMDSLVSHCDHHVWNDKMENPTVEHIANWFAVMLTKALAIPVTIRVHEGPRSWAEVSI